MNILDFILLAIAFLSFYSGWQKGFILGFVDLLVAILSLLFAFVTYPYLVSVAEKYWPSLGIFTTPLAFVVMLIAGRVALLSLAQFLLRQVPSKAQTHKANHLLGIVPGAINGLIWMTILSALFLALPLSEMLSNKSRDSLIVSALAPQVEWANEQFSPVFDDAVNKTFNRLTIEPGSEKSIKLPYTVSKATVRPDLEAEMLKLVNEERAEEGVKPLVADTALQQVARLHCADMFARGYFSHLTPEGKTPFDRIRAHNIRFLTAGENLALGQTLSICHKGLMNSPGHRANILNPAFGRLGIGILDGGIYGLMITQNFKN